MDDLIKQLELYRLENRITQQELADEIGVNFSTVSRWLNGKTRPNKTQRHHINKFLTKKQTAKKYNSKGMTLVEVLVAMLIVGLIIGAVISTFQIGSAMSRNLDLIYTGTYLAERRIELLKRFSFESLSVYEENDVRIGSDGNVAVDGEYLRSTEITNPYKGNPYMAKVKVSVSRVRIHPDGSINDPGTGNPDFIGTPITMETVFADIE